MPDLSERIQSFLETFGGRQADGTLEVRTGGGDSTVQLVLDLSVEVDRLRAWVNDCQSGMYINCVYCGHRYGPRESTPVAMADVLKAHIEKCPKHPLSHAKAEIERLRAIVDKQARA